MITGELRSKVDKLWETFWSNGISNPISVIEQISYLLFIKRLDDLELTKEKKQRLNRPVKDAVFSRISFGFMTWRQMGCRWMINGSLFRRMTFLICCSDGSLVILKRIRIDRRRFLCPRARLLRMATIYRSIVTRRLPMKRCSMSRRR